MVRGMSPVSGSAVAGVVALAVVAARLLPSRCVKVKLNLLVHESERLRELEVLERVLKWKKKQEISLSAQGQWHPARQWKLNFQLVGVK